VEKQLLLNTLREEYQRVSDTQYFPHPDTRTEGYLQNGIGDYVDAQKKDLDPKTTKWTPENKELLFEQLVLSFGTFGMRGGEARDYHIVQQWLEIRIEELEQELGLPRTKTRAEQYRELIRDQQNGD
jgi:hypothetical protein